ncbi:uracil-xanthine permease family protein [Thalassotalea ponticola]|uniref:uracil-xanthine permease family protein n=1 Tax=Thalassotalea ponticola TaxID=1523392 RepID=UPI0025B5FE8D|nr:uracil-xanthine permease family protein [Thalassotalea ponticola]MDN3651441.1 uracil-xanthine permease family protein [Thalassotalea ponticola]
MNSIVTPLLGLQMLFVAFGALVLVPILTGLDPNVALFTAGIGTLVFQLVTKRQVPVFLASSFAFIAPISYGVATWGIASTMSGLAAAGLFYLLLSALVAWQGNQIIHRILPPVVVAPVIMVIGLNLAPVGVNMALGKTGDGAMQLVDANTALLISLSSLAVTVLVSLFGKGLFKLVPILAGLIVGYVLSLTFGIVNFDAVASATWFALPNFTFPQFHWEAILFILPIAIAPAVEHIGDITAISQVAGKDYLEKPGLKRTLMGDGLATSVASFFGGPPNTTYSEVTGAVALTKSFNPVIMTWAAIFAIALSFVGKTGALLSTIPVPVMGGIMVLLFGAIAVVGLKTLINAQVDLGKTKNMTIVAVALVFGLGGMQFDMGIFQLKGIALAAVSAILLNLLLPSKR